MSATKLIMAWSKCKVSLGPTGASDVMGTTLTDVGVIKDKSTTLEATDGDELKAVATGGDTVAEDHLEGTLMLKTTVMEPTDALYTLLGLGAANATSGYDVKTHIANGDFSAQVEPKNVGATGIKAALCHVVAKPSFAEDAGNAIDLEITILKSVITDIWYNRYVKAAPAAPAG